MLPIKLELDITWGKLYLTRTLLALKLTMSAVAGMSMMTTDSRMIVPARVFFEPESKYRYRIQ
jgi:hypothetical protein